ncbi:membrane protein [Candidatus Magnetomorum sp. HK-1]|nr:membrane protein [Candidatus Magnetomorum sp. HK-1]
MDTVYKSYNIDEKINIKVVIGVGIFFCGFLYHFIHTLYQVKRTISKRSTINSMIKVLIGATFLSLSRISSRVGIHIEPEYKEVFIFWSTIIATICLSSGTIFYYKIIKKNIPDPLEIKSKISLKTIIYLIIGILHILKKVVNTFRVRKNIKRINPVDALFFDFYTG